MKPLILCLSLAIPSLLSANGHDIAGIFASHDVQGALLIQSLDGEIEYLHSARHADIGYIPASTFKIPHTLIALQEGVIKDQFEIIKWDRVKRKYPLWNKDQTLKTAFSISCVWCYQGFAKQIGNEKYLDYLDKFAYGNKKTGDELTRFWLDGDLRVSVREQVNFLRKLYLHQLPVSRTSYEILKDIMLAEETRAYKLWAKTGWSGVNGWYVGYLKVNNNIWFFANYIKIRTEKDLILRKKLVLEAFRHLGIIKNHVQ